MGLFSSKSKSSSSTNVETTTIDNSNKASGTVGDLSSDNLIAGGNITYNGFGNKSLEMILDNNAAITNETISGMKSSIGEAISQVASAYSGANQSILESQSETKTLLRSLQPFMLYAAAAFAAWAFFKYGKG